jgi:hypothetical protein
MNINKILAIAALSAFSLNAFALKDFDLPMPFDNITVHQYESLKAYTRGNRNDLLDITCIIRSPKPSHYNLPIRVESVNLQSLANSSPDGIYTLVNDIPQYVIKHNVGPKDMNYNSNIALRFTEDGNAPPDIFVVSCKAEHHN